MAEQKELFFYFDPICPWAWRASLWIREVAKVRPIKIGWDFLSLAAANAGKDSLQQLHSQSDAAFRTMAFARRLGGNEAVDKLYLALGRARHERKEELNDPHTIETALTEAGLDTTLLSQALEDPSTLDIVQHSHSYITERKGFGVPTMVLKDGDRESLAMFGPVLSKVPQGEEAGQLWDRIEWLMWQPDFFELKRNR